MQELGFYCEHKTSEKDMPTLLSSNYSSNMLIYISLYYSHTILNCFHLYYSNSFLFGLSVIFLAQCKAKASWH